MRRASPGRAYCSSGCLQPGTSPSFEELHQLFAAFFIFKKYLLIEQDTQSKSIEPLLEKEERER